MKISEESLHADIICVGFAIIILLTILYEEISHRLSSSHEHPKPVLAALRRRLYRKLFAAGFVGLFLFMFSRTGLTSRVDKLLNPESHQGAEIGGDVVADGDGTVRDSMIRDGDSIVRDSMDRDGDGIVRDAMIRDGDSIVRDSMDRDGRDSIVRESIDRDGRDGIVRDPGSNFGDTEGMRRHKDQQNVKAVFLESTAHSELEETLEHVQFMIGNMMLVLILTQVSLTYACTKQVRIWERLDAIDEEEVMNESSNHRIFPLSEMEFWLMRNQFTKPLLPSGWMVRHRGGFIYSGYLARRLDMTAEDLSSPDLVVWVVVFAFVIVCAPMLFFESFIIDVVFIIGAFSILVTSGVCLRQINKTIAALLPPMDVYLQSLGAVLANPSLPSTAQANRTARARCTSTIQDGIFVKQPYVTLDTSSGKRRLVTAQDKIMNRFLRTPFFFRRFLQLLHVAMIALLILCLLGVLSSFPHWLFRSFTSIVLAFSIYYAWPELVTRFALVTSMGTYADIDVVHEVQMECYIGKLKRLRALVRYLYISVIKPSDFPAVDVRQALQHYYHLIGEYDTKVVKEVSSEISRLLLSSNEARLIELGMAMGLDVQVINAMITALKSLELRGSNLSGILNEEILAYAILVGHLGLEIVPKWEPSEIFSKIDTDNDGQVDESDLLIFYAKVNPNLNRSEAKGN